MRLYEQSVVSANVQGAGSRRTSFSCAARFERATDTGGANAERTQREAQALRRVTAALDRLPACAVIVVNDELTLLLFQLLQTPTNPLEPLPFDRESFAWLVGWHTGAGRCDSNLRLAKSDMQGLAPDILKQDRLRDHITVRAGGVAAIAPSFSNVLPMRLSVSLARSSADGRFRRSKYETSRRRISRYRSPCDPTPSSNHSSNRLNAARVSRGSSRRTSSKGTWTLLFFPDRARLLSCHLSWRESALSWLPSQPSCGSR